MILGRVHQTILHFLSEIRTSENVRRRGSKKETFSSPYEALEPRKVLSSYFPAYVDGSITLGNRDNYTPYGLQNTFNLESKAGAEKTIYLDFNGHHSQGNEWGHSIHFPAYDRDGNNSSFNNTELREIQRIFQNVAEDFLPFNINVTTKDPGVEALKRSGSYDHNFGVRVVMTKPTNGFGDGAGGIAKHDSFHSSTDTPVFSFAKGAGNAAMVASHETGHSMGLEHDGYFQATYHPGIGEGKTKWGPIMGAAYATELTQWSNGDYNGASNSQDDLATITSEENGITFRPDDAGNTRNTASDLNRSPARVFDWGIISNRNDVDLYKFTVANSGRVTLSVNPLAERPNLDVQAQILNANGNVVANANPQQQTKAKISKVLSAGDYYLKIDGVGKVGAYSDYGSLGFYTIEGTIQDSNVKQIGESGRTHGLTDQWRFVKFDRTYVDPVVIVGPATNKGGESATVRVRNVTNTGFQVRIEEWNYLDGQHIKESIGWMVVEAGRHVLGDGTVLYARNGWANENFRNITFGIEFEETPIVLAQATSKFGNSTVTPRVTNVSESGFRIKLQEQENRIAGNSYEKVGFLAIETGKGNSHDLKFDAISNRNFNHEKNSYFFKQKFDERPIVLAGIQTFRGDDPGSIRLTEMTKRKAMLFLQEEQSLDNERLHAKETVGMFAINVGKLFAIDYNASTQPRALETVRTTIDSSLPSPVSIEQTMEDFRSQLLAQMAAEQLDVNPFAPTKQLNSQPAE